MDAVSITCLRKKFPINNSDVAELKVLDGISFNVKKGEFVGVIGPNGCGKTTLLKLVLGIEKPNSGSVSILGRTPEEVRVGYVAQHNTGSLYPWFTASENIAFADSLNTITTRKAMNRLAEFGIENYANAYPYQLSGGIKQLVSIARATVRSEVFLFDEPFSALDYQNRFFIEEVFLKLRDGNNSALLVSHDIESTILTCDKLVLLTEKPTRIKAVMPVNLPIKRTSKTRLSPEFNLVLHEVLRVLNGE